LTFLTSNTAEKHDVDRERRTNDDRVEYLRTSALVTVASDKQNWRSIFTPLLINYYYYAKAE